MYMWLVVTFVLKSWHVLCVRSPMRRKSTCDKIWKLVPNWILHQLVWRIVLEPFSFDATDKGNTYSSNVDICKLTEIEAVF